MLSTHARDRPRPSRQRVEVIDADDLIGSVNVLQSKFSASGKILDISLPQIVVVGCQSAGKSSVLESLIGRQCLPRGTGVVTRRPTIIQLYPSEEAYAVFDHDEARASQKIHDFEQVKEEIRRLTEQNPGPNGFSDTPINLKIYVPNVLKLTLVDLPGIIKINIDGQSEESILAVNNMIMRFIEQPNSIILAVTPATQDIATSDSLQMAYKVDPERTRTIGVLTKLDMMDPGTNACAVLDNSLLYLERGYVGVVNRNQRDIVDGKDIAYSLEKEKTFFEDHPAYSHMAERMGTPYLMRVLHKQLKEHIKKTLPSLKKGLSQKLNCLKRELRSFDELWGNECGEEGAQAYLLKALELFKDDVEFKLFGKSDKVDFEKFSPGAIINYSLYTDLQLILTLPTALLESEIIKKMFNLLGITSFLAIPHLTLESACKEILKKYEEPLGEFVDKIMEIVSEAIEDSASSVYIHPTLKSALMHFVGEAINGCTEETKDLIGKYLKAQGTFCNVYHWDLKNQITDSGFPCSPVKVWDIHQTNGSKDNGSRNNSTKDASEAATSASISEASISAFISDNISSEDLSAKLMASPNSRTNAQNVMQLLVDYMQMLQKQIGDVCLKYIVCFLIHGVFDFIKSKLTAKIFSSEHYNSLTAEFSRVIDQREEAVTMCSYIESALDAIQRF